MRITDLFENDSNLGKHDLKGAFNELKKHSDDSLAKICVNFSVPRKLNLLKLKDFFYSISNHYKIKNEIAYHEKFYANEFDLVLEGSVLRLKMAIKTYMEKVENIQNHGK